jgi:hypothetical protein
VRASSQQLARTVVHLDVSPLGTPNTVIPIGDPASIPTLLDTGRLAEVCAFTSQKGQAKYAVVVNPSQAGAVGSVTLSGTGTGTLVPSCAPHKPITVKCVTGGVLGTAAYQFSTDGGVTWSATVTSTASTYSVRVPGTYCTLSFAAATYVVNKTATIGIDGTVTNGSGWVGVVTQTSSPIDDYEVQATITKGGALGVAIAQVSLDAGNSTLPTMLIPSGGVVVIPGTGLVLTFSGTFTALDVYSFLAIGPGFSTTDLNNALTALKSSRTVQASLIHVSAMPSSAAGAFSAAAVLDAAMGDAFSNGVFDWQAACDCPSSGGGMRITSTLSAFGRKALRPLSWLAVDLYVRTDPKDELAATALGGLRVFQPAGATSIKGPGDIVMPSSSPVYDTADTDTVIIGARGSDLTRTSVFVGGRDEAATPGLDDVQINTARTYGGSLTPYLSITSGVSGWKNLSTDAFWVDAGAVRALNSMIAALRPVIVQLLGQRPKANSDGTIAETAAGGLDTVVNGAVQRALGLAKGGGDFKEPQASRATASILRSSQVGANPKRLDVAYTFQPLGEITAVSNAVSASGTLSLSLVG